MDYQNYKNKKDELRKESEALAKELRVCANRLFSTDDGKKIANQMITAVKYFDCLPSQLSNEDLRYIQAQRDFVSVFLIGLIEKKTLLSILEERK